MACTAPLTAYRAASANASGRRSLVFGANASASGIAIQIPCGQCASCRLERSRQWAVRCMHERALYDDNCCINLTYDDAHLPKHGSLVKADFQKFCKRLRKSVVAARGRGFRFFACGEYGEQNGRPHYHALLFDLDFHDKKKWRTTDKGSVLYRSAVLERYWPLGHVELGEANFESAAYVARYCVKKITGRNANDYYMGRLPEFGLMSNRPGIGKPWFDKFFSDVYPNDFVIVRGRKCLPPRFYDKWLERLDPSEYDNVKSGRKPHTLLEFKTRKEDSTRARLAVKDEIVSSRLAQLKRG